MYEDIIRVVWKRMKFSCMIIKIIIVIKIEYYQMTLILKVLDP